MANNNPEGINQYTGTHKPREFKSGAGMTSSVKKRRKSVVMSALPTSNGKTRMFKGKTYRDQSARRKKFEELTALRKKK